MSGFRHIPVMPEEVIASLRIRPEGTYLDGTAGGGGHSELIARQLSGEGRLYCLDQDEDAVKAAGERLKPYGDRVKVIRGNFADAAAILDGEGAGLLDGVLLDLGVSSHQLDTPERGFSYMADAELDMRMDQRSLLSAKRIVNEYSEEELARILREYGEERYAKRIAGQIVSARQEKRIERTLELSELIERAVPADYRRSGGHPAMRTFQALRIEANQELSVLERALEDLIERLSAGGRIAVISFHSLEDRIVKNIFRRAEHPCTCPPDFPVCICGKKPKGRSVNRKPILPGEKEIRENSRAHSAKLRVFERIRGE